MFPIKPVYEDTKYGHTKMSEGGMIMGGSGTVTWGQVSPEEQKQMAVPTGYENEAGVLDNMRAAVDSVKRQAQKARDAAAFHRFEAERLDMVAQHLDAQVDEVEPEEEIQ